ncbi:MAG: DUF4878 domain-containing protein [Treponema sp.]|jgi:hypothetical protein|nr:DUF4878 domain-containing protein [Treponema sp.]
MKKWQVIVMFISLLVLSLLFAGCVKAGSPTAVVKQFHAALGKGDAEAIGRYSTPETAQLLGMYLDKAKGMMAVKGKIKTTEETVDGDIAKVTVTYKTAEPDTFTLVKIDGEWKVLIDMGK